MIGKLGAIASALSLSVLVGGARQELSQSTLVTLAVDQAAVVGHLLEDLGYDVAGINPAKGQVEVVVLDRQVAPAILRDLERFGHALQRAPQLTASEPFAAFADRRDSGDMEYMDVAQTTAALEALAAQHPEHAHMFNLTRWLGAPKTAEGRDLIALQISSNPSAVEDEPKIIIVGEHHARELMTHTAVVDSAKDYLKRALGGEAPFAQALDQLSIWFVPMVNPDGLHHVFQSDRMWRKNRNRNANGSYGVDVNRNYEFKWAECGANSSVGSSEIYAGSKPFSEPESLTMDMLNNRLRAQYLISYHSSGDEVLYPYLCGDLAEAEGYYDLRDRLADKLEYGQRPASSSGEDFEHHYARYGTLSFLLETGYSFQPSYREYERGVWARVQRVIPFLLEEVNSRPFLNLKVVDAEGAPVSGAQLELAEINFREGETRSTDAFGRYRWQLAAGTYQLTVSAAGLSAASSAVHVEGAGLTRETVIRLTR